MAEYMDIGQQIRALRKAKGLTLQQLGQRVKLSPSYLSQIENGKINLNLSNLQDIAIALDVPIINFFAGSEDLDVSIVRKGERRVYSCDGHATETLLFVKDKLDLEAAIIDLPPHSNSGKAGSHPGEEFTFVLSGSVRIWLNDKRYYDLEEGDIIYYRSLLSHYWENVGDESASIFVTNTPATF
ncbi:MAG: XRE family transcriptional regulator [Chloroflexi bacterium]|nr:XRE family transcriptional regulator [Chloroflexota bacterium]MCL5074427.1 XRE family transcriptional regulator [Chloroflexota bacterium]